MIDNRAEWGFDGLLPGLKPEGMNEHTVTERAYHSPQRSRKEKRSGPDKNRSVDKKRVQGRTLPLQDKVSPTDLSCNTKGSSNGFLLSRAKSSCVSGSTRPCPVRLLLERTRSAERNPPDAGSFRPFIPGTVPIGSWLSERLRERRGGSRKKAPSRIRHRNGRDPSRKPGRGFEWRSYA